MKPEKRHKEFCDIEPNTLQKELEDLGVCDEVIEVDKYGVVQ